MNETNKKYYYVKINASHTPTKRHKCLLSMMNEGLYPVCSGEQVVFTVTLDKSLAAVITSD